MVLTFRATIVAVSITFGRGNAGRYRQTQD